MGKIYFYQTSTNFEYYWKDNLHFAIQITTVKNLLSYAVIYSQMTSASKELLETLINKGEVIIIEEDIFKNKLQQAIDIIMENC